MIGVSRSADSTLCRTRGDLSARCISRRSHGMSGFTPATDLDGRLCCSISRDLLWPIAAFTLCARQGAAPVLASFAGFLAIRTISVNHYGLAL